MGNIQNDPVLSGNVQITKCGVLVCSTFVTYCVAYSGSLFQSCGNVWMKMSRTLTWQWPTSDWLNAVTLIKWWSRRCYISSVCKGLHRQRFAVTWSNEIVGQTHSLPDSWSWLNRTLVQTHALPLTHRHDLHWFWGVLSSISRVASELWWSQIVT